MQHTQNGVSDQLERTERLLNRVSGYIYVYHAIEQRNVYANRDMGDILGYTPQELRNMGSALLATIMHPDDFARLPQIFQRITAAADSEVVEWEYRVQDRHGTWIWFQDRMTVFSRDQQGNLVEYVGSVQDITDRKRMEAHLHENQQRLEFILEGSGDGAWDWNLTNNAVYLSPGYRTILGYQPEELPDAVSSWTDLIHPDDAAEVQQQLQDYLEGRSESYAVEHRLQHSSGAWLWILSRSKIMTRDEAGNPLRVTGTISDITERKQIQESLRTFKSVIDNASDAIAITRPDDATITYYNDAYRDLYRCGEHHMGQNIAVVVAPQDQEHLPGIIQEIAETGVWKGQLLHIRADGTTFPALESCFATKDSEGNIEAMVGIVRDITDMVAAEAERVALQEQIIEAQRFSLRELSSPLIPIADTVVIMPLIGSIDSGRAQQVMETLLDGVAQRRADVAILDITGIKVVDTQVANALIQAAQAVKLLGAQVILTGIGPAMAQTLVGLGIDLSSIVTYANLQSAIAHVMRRR